jgi:two-component system, response regulator
MKENFVPIILMADDDPDDRMLMKEALAEAMFPHSIHFVSDGAELLDYLNKRGRFGFEKTFRPHLILLDLNMPKIDGREALAYIKADPGLKRIPVIILTTSVADEDIIRAYDLGVNSFICKPSGFDKLVEVVRGIGNYWFGPVALPKS